MRLASCQRSRTARTGDTVTINFKKIGGDIKILKFFCKAVNIFPMDGAARPSSNPAAAITYVPVQIAPIMAPLRSRRLTKFKMGLLVLFRTFTPAQTNTMRQFLRFSGSMLVCTSIPLLATLLMPSGLATIHSKICLPLWRFAARKGSMAEAKASNEN